MIGVAEGEDALLGARLLLVATCPTESRIEAVTIERLLQALRLHHIGVDLGGMAQRRDAARLALRIDVDEEVEPVLARDLVAKRDHLLELPGRIDMEERKGQPSGCKGLHGEVQEHRGILADRIEQHRALTFCDDLAHDVNALGLEAVEVCET